MILIINFTIAEALIKSKKPIHAHLMTCFALSTLLSSHVLTVSIKAQYTIAPTAKTPINIEIVFIQMFILILNPPSILASPPLTSCEPFRHLSRLSQIPAPVVYAHPTFSSSSAANVAERYVVQRKRGKRRSTRYVISFFIYLILKVICEAMY